MTPEYFEGRKEEAKRIVRDHLFRDYMDNQGRNSAVQMRIYERKALLAFMFAQFQVVSPVLQQEADLRGTTVQALATEILTESNKLNLIELERIRINIDIDACTKLSDIGKLMIDERIPVPPGVYYFDPVEPTPPE